MRLTLRTLLAYLDDTLEPAQANLIGQKVAESSVAEELIDRIKRVTRRRSLANPSIVGEDSKLDPNTVAEYLNDELSADELSEVEQICLEQDVYLAEVAACHQILTLMLSEPSRVPPTARQRMYRLVKGRESIPYRRPPVFDPIVDPRLKDADESEEAKTTRWPLYVAGAVVLLVGLGIAVYLAWPTSSTGPGLTTEPPILAALPAAQGESTRSTEPTKSNPTTAPAKTELLGPTLPPKTTPTPTEPAATTTQKTTPQPTQPNTIVVKKPIDKAPANEPSDRRIEVGRLSSPAVVLVERTGGAKPGWRRIPSDGRISTDVQLVSLPGYRSDLKFDNGVGVSLWGSLPIQTDVPRFECAVTLHAPPEGFKADLTLDRGRLVLANPMTGKLKVRMRVREGNLGRYARRTIGSVRDRSADLSERCALQQGARGRATAGLGRPGRAEGQGQRDHSRPRAGGPAGSAGPSDPAVGQQEGPARPAEAASRSAQLDATIAQPASSQGGGRRHAQDAR